MKNNFIVIFVTCVSRKEARGIISRILKKRLIACGNIIPGVESRFWWKGKIERTEEVLIIMKSKDKNFKDIEKEIKKIHSYEVPEIIALPIRAGDAHYLKWLEDSTI